MKKHYVYMITNNINGKLYIGKRGTNNDIFEDKYMGSGIAINRAYKKYGIENFTKTIIEICNTEEEAFIKEIYWIAKYDTYNNGYNMTLGGEGVSGFNMANSLSQERYEEWRRKLSKSAGHMKGKKISEEHRQKIKKNHGMRGRTGKDCPTSKQAVIIYKNKVIIKYSATELAKYMNENYGLSYKGVRTNWHYKIPKKHKNDIQFVGLVDSDKWREYYKLNNIDRVEVA